MFPDSLSMFRFNPGHRAGRPVRRLLVLVAAAILAGAGSAAGQGPAGPEPDILLVPADRSLQYDTNLGLVDRATNEAVEEALAGLRLEPGSEIRLHALTSHEASWFVEDVIARYLTDRGYHIHLMPQAKKPETTTGTPGAATGGDPDDSAASSLAEALARSAGTQSTPPDSVSVDSLDASAKRPEADVVAAAPRSTAGPAGRPNQPGPGTAPPPEPDPSEVIPIPEGEGLVLTFRLIQFGVTYHDSWRRGFMGPRVVERLASVNLFTRLVSGDAENVLWVGQGKSEKLDIVPQSKIDLLEGMSYPFRKPEIRQKPLSRFLEPVLVSSIIGGLIFLFYTNQD